MTEQQMGIIPHVSMGSRIVLNSHSMVPFKWLKVEQVRKAK